MIEIEIDGQKLTVDEGASIIEAADAAGIHIPRFCYHKKLSVAANCRMCLVDVERVGKPVPACATPVSADMKVSTKSPKALEAQRAVLSFLLINHPLDCPICDQGGQCELQDMSMGYGAADSSFTGKKRAVFSGDLGPLIDTNMTRCIHCTRCVRFGEEVAKLPELGVVGRGEESAISTYISHMMASELSGNVVDICPVGALTEKPSRYTVRSWEAVEHPSVAPHDSVGSHIYIHTKAQEHDQTSDVMRVVPRECEAINETWLSDRDRFGYDGLHHSDRCLSPMMRRDGEWVTVSWSDAISEVVSQLSQIKDAESAAALGLLMSPMATLEEAYLARRWFEQLGSPNMDYRLRARDLSDLHHPLSSPAQGVATADIATLDVIVLVGSNVRFDQPILGHRINQAVSSGAKVFVINPMDYVQTITVAGSWIGHDLASPLEQMVSLLQSGSAEQSDRSLGVMAEALKAAQSGAIFMGPVATHHPHASRIRQGVAQLAELTGARVGTFSEGPNAVGMHRMGVLPQSQGLSAWQMLNDSPRSAYVLMGVEPEHDVAAPHQALTHLRHAQCCIQITPYVTDTMKSYAHVILPMAPFSETAGSFVNGEGVHQSFEAAVSPRGEAQPGWKILRAIARARHDVAGEDDWPTIQALAADALASSAPVAGTTDVVAPSVSDAPLADATCWRIGSHPAYAIDGLCRRAPALQETLRVPAAVHMHPEDAVEFSFADGERVVAQQGESTVTLPVVLDQRMARGLVWIPAGLPETAGFGDTYAPVTLVKESS